MKKIRTGVVPSAILICVIILFSTSVNRNIQDIGPRKNIEDALSLVKTQDIILSMAEAKDEEILDNKIVDEIIEETIIEDDIVIAEEIPEERISNAPNRGGEIKPNRLPMESQDMDLNQYVLDVIQGYSLEEGNYPYLLNNDFQNYNGVTEDLYYKGELLLKANPNGNKASHCTGITFEVFFKAMQERNKSLGIPIDDFNGMNKEELGDFILTWYVAKGPKSQSNLLLAIEKYGLGTKITNLEDLRPGDFVDLSRENNTGHAVVFQNWIREGNRIIGLRHWSSQGSTNGISYKEEYFNVKDKNGKKYGNVIIDQLNMARVGPVNQYKKY